MNIYYLYSEEQKNRKYTQNINIYNYIVQKQFKYIIITFNIFFKNKNGFGVSMVRKN